MHGRDVEDVFRLRASVLIPCPVAIRTSSSREAGKNARISVLAVSLHRGSRLETCPLRSRGPPISVRHSLLLTVKGCSPPIRLAMSFLTAALVHGRLDFIRTLRPLRRSHGSRPAAAKFPQAFRKCRRSGPRLESRLSYCVFASLDKTDARSVIATSGCSI